MFRKIQKNLLINHPLLWNSKIVPLTFFAVVFHIIFFLIGYVRGTIDFTETDTNYSFDASEGTLIFFSVLISILSLIIWCVYYFKNNALKSFYPKNNFSLFKEWLLIFFGSLLIVTFLVSYFYGKETRVRSYFTENEARKRTEILSLGSFFVNGSYSYYYDNDVAEVVETEPNVDDTIRVNQKNYILYKGKKYSANSLLNKNINSYSFIDAKKDSIYVDRIKNLLVTNQKDSIQKIFKNYLTIAKEHNLKSSIDDKKWLQLIYDYPTFENYKTIGSEEKDVYYLENNDYDKSKIDTTEQYLVQEKEGNFLYNRFYVPEKQLHHAYQKISNSYTNPTISWESYLIALYVALGVSLLLFSFRVTSGKNWLITLVSLGVLNILIGIITAIFGSEYVYLSGILIIFTFSFLYFITTISAQKGKGISGITINAMLWILPAFAPIMYFFILEITKKISGYNNAVGLSRDILYPKITFLQDSGFLFFLTYLNLLFVVIVMLYLSKKIKQWRGIAEN